MAFSSLLDEPTIRERMMRFSVEQYQLLGEAGLIGTDVELLEGIIVKKMSKSPLHVFITQKLALLLRKFEADGWLIRQAQPIKHQDSEPEPDISVVHGHAEDFLTGHPTSASLVIEVAVSSFGFDHEKRAIYAAANVPEYWIILPEAKRVEVYTRPVGRDYTVKRLVEFPALVLSETLSGFELNLGTFFPT